MEIEIADKRLPGKLLKSAAGGETFSDDFRGNTLDLSWNTLYESNRALISVGDGLCLKGNMYRLSDDFPIAWVGRRQSEFYTHATVTLEFAPSEDGEEAGLTVYMNNEHHYEAAVLRKAGRSCLIFRRQIGSLWKVEKEEVINHNRVILEIVSDLESYRFYATVAGERKLLGCGETKYLTTEVGGAFTGNYYAMYAVGNGKACEDRAVFRDFQYRAWESEQKI